MAYSFIGKTAVTGLNFRRCNMTDKNLDKKIMELKEGLYNRFVKVSQSMRFTVS